MTDFEPLSPSASDIKEKWFASIRSTKSQAEDRGTLGTVAASPNVYVNVYTFKNWQRFFFPVLTKRIRNLTQRSSDMTSLQNPSLWDVEKKLSTLEFRDQISSPSLRMRVRRQILLHGLSAWTVRQAFNSLALRKIGESIEIRDQPQGLHPVCTTLMWISACLSLIFFAQAAIDVISPQLTQAEIGRLCLKLQLSILLVFLLYRLGPQWKVGICTLQKLGFRREDSA